MTPRHFITRQDLFLTLSPILITGAQQLLNLGGQLATLHEWSDIPLRGRSPPWTAAAARVKDHALAVQLLNHPPCLDICSPRRLEIAAQAYKPIATFRTTRDLLEGSTALEANHLR